MSAAGLIVLLQGAPCYSRTGLHKEFRSLPLCWRCASPPKHRSECLFNGTRCVRLEDGVKTVSFANQAETVEEPYFPEVFAVELFQEVANLKKDICSRVLLPILKGEVLHVERPDIVMLPWELSYRVACDLCWTELFSCSWLCGSCGRDVCSQCKDQYGCQCNKPGYLVPVTRFRQGELQSAIELMSAADKYDWIDVNAHQEISIGDVPTLSMQVIDYPSFNIHWRRGIPVIVSGVRFQGRWGPQDLIKKFGEKKVKVQNCETECTYGSTVAKFFQYFGSSANRPQGILKLKDWPPEAAFSREFPELFEDFKTSIPLPHITRLDGILNLAAHFPFNSVRPDLGPKMYNALASPQDDQHHGSTRLHLDMTDAINVMMWAAPKTDGTAGGALWHIFHSSSKAKLRTFLRQHVPLEKGDPIHSQSVYLTQSMLTELSEEHNVRPYIIYQHVGEAVFIPAGCAHQVSNVTDCIKIACDFTSVEHIFETIQVAAELRSHRRFLGGGDDVLQIHTSLWYAWCFLSSRTFRSAPTSSSSTESAAANSAVNSIDAQAAPSVSEHQAHMTSTGRSQEPLATKEFPCPFACRLRLFNRGGLVDHLNRKHGNRVRLTAAKRKQLRRGDSCSDAEFWVIAVGACRFEGLVIAHDPITMYTG